MDISGKVTNILTLQTGEGRNGTWKKQEFVIETQAQFPKKVCFSLWGEKIDQARLAENDMVTVSFDLESREYNGRWYTEAKAWKVSKSAEGGTSAGPPPADYMADFIPESSDQADDLPF